MNSFLHQPGVRFQRRTLVTILAAAVDDGALYLRVVTRAVLGPAVDSEWAVNVDRIDGRYRSAVRLARGTPPWPFRAEREAARRCGLREARTRLGPPHAPNPPLFPGSP